MPNVKVEKRYYANGKIESEITFVDGVPNGINRRWYPNGVLADETPIQNGRCEGVAKHWGENGDLIGTYEMRDGTGLMRTWYNNGVLSGEISFVKGQFTGRQRVWFEDGELVTQLFWIRGRKVSKKKYLEASKEDPSLPRYENEPKIQTWEQKMKRLSKKATKPDRNMKAEEATKASLQKMLADPNLCEARQWLADKSAVQSRTLGELPDQTESMALIDDAYRAGVSQVLVARICRDDSGRANSGTLLVQLPSVPKKRKKALDWCNEQNGYQGFDPEDDTGQEWIIVALD